MLQIVHVDPRSAGYHERLKSALRDASAAAIILHAVLDREELSALAEDVASSKVSLISVWGPESEALHDLIDRVSLERRETCPLTTWDVEDSINHFLRTFVVVYRGTLSVSDQDRPTVVCYVSGKEVPAQLKASIESFRSEFAREHSPHGGDVITGP